MLNELYDSYKILKRGKTKEDMVVFDMHPQANILSVDRMVEGGYRPSYKAFVTPKPRPREIVHPVDFGQRIVEKYIEDRIRPILERHMSNRSYSGRKGYGPDVAIEQVRRDMYEITSGYTTSGYYIKEDIRNCFPSANRQIMCDKIVEVVGREYVDCDKGFLLKLIKEYYLGPIDIEMVSEGEKWREISKEKSLLNRNGFVGAPMGSTLFHLGVNFMLTDVDIWLKKHHIKFVRYMDDFVFSVADKDDFLPLIPEFREVLHGIGFEVNEKKFYCQTYQHGVSFLGRYIKFNRVYIDNTTIWRLREKIKYFNRHIKKNRLHRMISELNPYFNLLNKTMSFNILTKVIGMIDKRWWEMCYFDNDRGCIVAKIGFKERDMVMERYGLKRDRYVRENRKLPKVPREVDYDEDDMLKWLWDDDDDLKWLWDSDKGLRDRRYKMKSVKR